MNQPTKHARAVFAAFEDVLTDPEHVIDADEIHERVERLIEQGHVGLRPFNDTWGNASIMGQTSKGMSGMTEVSKNMHDAIIERERIERGIDLSGVANAHEAAQILLPDLDMNDKISRGRYAERARLAIYTDPSEGAPQSDRGTVRAIDQGIGLRAEDFPTTLCSRGDSRKARQSWQLGKFNSGFSQAAVQARVCLIRSCHAQAASFTALYRLQTGEHKGSYVYLVDPTTNLPFECPQADLAGVSQGTDIMLVDYRLGKDALHKIDSDARGFRKRLRNYLVRPILPIRLSRTGVSHTYNFDGALRVESDAISHEISKKISFSHDGVSYGNLELTARVYVDNKSDRFYRDEAVKLVYNEGSYAFFSSDDYKRRTRFGYLPQQSELFIDMSEIDEDMLFDDFFTLDRSQLRDTDVAKVLINRVWEAIREWDELCDIESDLVAERARSMASLRAVDLGKFIRQLSSGNVLPFGGRGKVRPPRAVKPVELSEIPTWAKVTTPPLGIRPDGAPRLHRYRVASDAPDGSIVYMHLLSSAGDGSESRIAEVVQAGAATRGGIASINVKARDHIKPANREIEDVIVRVSITTPGGENRVFDLPRRIEVHSQAYHMRQSKVAKGSGSAPDYVPLFLPTDADDAPARLTNFCGEQLHKLGGDEYSRYVAEDTYKVIVINTAARELVAAQKYYARRPKGDELWTRHLAALYHAVIASAENTDTQLTPEERISRELHTFHAHLTEYSSPEPASRDDEDQQAA
jgi:hypothetical protein